MVTRSTGWVVTRHAVLRTTDGGTSWSQAHELLRTTNGGRTWTRIEWNYLGSRTSTEPLPACDGAVASMKLTSRGVGWVTGICGPGPQFQMAFLTRDGGKTWHQQKRTLTHRGVPFDVSYFDPGLPSPADPQDDGCIDLACRDQSSGFLCAAADLQWPLLVTDQTSAGTPSGVRTSRRLFRVELRPCLGSPQGAPVPNQQTPGRLADGVSSPASGSERPARLRNAEARLCCQRIHTHPSHPRRRSHVAFGPAARF